MTNQNITYTPAQIELAKSLPYSVATVKEVFELLGNDEYRAETILCASANTGVNPVDVASIIFEIKRQKRRWPINSNYHNLPRILRKSRAPVRGPNAGKQPGTYQKTVGYKKRLT